MKKIFIIHENDEWVEPLRVHLHNLQVTFEEWHESYCRFFKKRTREARLTKY